MTDTVRLVDWDLATATATRLAPRGPRVTRDEAFGTVRQLRRLAVEAEDHVAAFTGLSAPHPHDPANVVDRAGWIEGNVGGFQVVMQPLLDKMAAMQAGKLGAPLVSAVGSRLTGAQVGLLLAYLSGKVLGQYELFLPPTNGHPTTGRLTLVAPNIVGAQRELDVDPHDFQLWVCVHEVTHRTQFTAVPWLRAHLQDEISAFLLASDLDPAALLGRLRAVGNAVRENMRDTVRDTVRNRGARDDADQSSDTTDAAATADATATADTADTAGPGLSLLEAVQNPEQRAVLNRLTAVMTLLEGHGEYVMNGVGPSVIPTVDEIGRKFSQRRRGQNPADRLVRKLFGLDMKARQYAEGAAFVRAVVERAGMASFNRVWTSPNTLPTKAEIAKPELWLRRVLRTKVEGTGHDGGQGDGGD
jgi:coenzyme F420 biosynthesis associated uncharacterized protein